jgi:carbon-monoxide dehydrogenase medium subunit
LKCTSRSADDWPALGIAVVLEGAAARIVLGAATDKPTRLSRAEAVLKQNPDALKEAGDAAADEVEIESDLHGSAAYKKQLLRVYLRRAIHEARNTSH